MTSVNRSADHPARICRSRVAVVAARLGRTPSRHAAFALRVTSLWVCCRAPYSAAVRPKAPTVVGLLMRSER